MLSVVMLSVIMLSVVMLSVVFLSTIMLSVVRQFFSCQQYLVSIFKKLKKLQG